MNYILGQLILAARRSNDGDNGWKQILVFVVLSAFYAISSIVKAKANKTASKGKEPLKPGRKQPESNLLKQLFGLPDTKSQAVKPKPQPPHPTSRKMAMFEPQMAKPSAFSPSRRGEPRQDGTSPLGGQIQPKLGKVTGFIAETAAPAEISQTKYLSEILSDYQDPESLRRAILHYEILGKPISLREPSEHF